MNKFKVGDIIKPKDKNHKHTFTGEVIKIDDNHYHIKWSDLIHNTRHFYPLMTIDMHYKLDENYMMKKQFDDEMKYIINSSPEGSVDGD